MKSTVSIRCVRLVFGIVVGLGVSLNAQAQSLQLAVGQSDYELQQFLPPQFGVGEFTLEVSVLLDDSLPVGQCGSGSAQRINWCDDDPQPYSRGDWWYRGNFLLDGFNNNSFGQGTFGIQVYGEGRIRWLFGDGQLRAVQAWPATETDSLLDRTWHKITLVRRYAGGGASLELYIDGSLIDSTPADQVNMQQWWGSWSGFPYNQEGWFWGAEKQAAIGNFRQYEDFKGLVDDRKFYSRAKTRSEIAQENDSLVGAIRYREGSGSLACDGITNVCTLLVETTWSPEDAPDVYRQTNPVPKPVAACANSADDDNDGLVDLADPGCANAADDDEIDIAPPPREVFTIDFESDLLSYYWADFTGWRIDTGGFAGNTTATLYPSNYSRFPEESASFSFSDPQVLTSLDIASRISGDVVITTDTESVTFPTSPNTPSILITEFSDPTSNVTIDYVGGEFGIDNIVTLR